MSGDIRRSQSLYTEGAVLQCAAMQGKDSAMVYARATADGAFNSMVRLVGSEEATGFAFLLADRVAGGLRQPTEMPVLTAALATPDARAAPTETQAAVTAAIAAVDRAEAVLTDTKKRVLDLEASLTEALAALAEEREGGACRLRFWRRLCVAWSVAAVAIALAAVFA